MRSAASTFLVLVGVHVGAPGCDRHREVQWPGLRTIGAQGTAPGQFVEPRAIAASKEGKLFAIDRTGRVQRFSASGGFEYFWEMPDNSPDVGKPSGICVDIAGRVFVADTHYHRIIVFDQGGHELFRFGERGSGPGQLILPCDVAVDRAGFIYVCEYGLNDRVSKFDQSGRYLFSFGSLSDGPAALRRPSGLAIDEDDNIWVADAGNHRVCCFDPQGTLRKTFGGLGTDPGRFRYPRDIVVLDGGALAVVDYGNSRVAYFDRVGRFLTCWGRPGRGDGELHGPLNVAGADGAVLVADSKNHRVVSLDREPFQEPEIAVTSRVGIQPTPGE
ncbi:MAG: hypothetical protein JSU86_05585 [Phycisphaerales bacterium]|nr:MAG: hypothetical protein JSU86_05585 [Phycisphaerales bacterium]